MTETELDNITGTIERITFYSEETGFVVLKINAPKQRDLVTVVGNGVDFRSGEHIRCEGSWVNNKQHGLQFKAETLTQVQPTTLEGIEKYLGSGLIKGIGPGFAKRLIKTFGTEVLNIIDQNPDKLLTLPGIGPSRRDKIVKAWSAQKVVRDIMIFLGTYGIGSNRAYKIYKKYGKNAIEKIKENPYRLSDDIRGIGFKLADSLGLQLGLTKDSPSRIMAGLSHLLQERTKQGHCACPSDDLIYEAQCLLSIPEPLVAECLEKAIHQKKLIDCDINSQACIMLPLYFEAEKIVAKHVHRLQEMPLPWETTIEPHTHQGEDFQLSQSQQQACELVLKSKISIITGGPGVGKTTVLKSLLHALKHQVDDIVLCAPTGRAAKRLSECTGLEAKTIHRLLAYDPGSRKFRHNEEMPLMADFVVIDECSMVDLLLMRDLLSAIPDEAGVLLVGDVDQLPSVGPGSVLNDFIRSNIIPTATLTEIYRQASHSSIITYAHSINKGFYPDFKARDHEKLDDFYYIASTSPEDIIDKMICLIQDRIPSRFGLNPLEDIQILTPMNRGSLGAITLNLKLQPILNPSQSRSVKRQGYEYKVGDKVIQTMNNYDKEVFNGDIGFITDIDEEGEVSIAFDETIVNYEINDLDQISLAYATTIHKSQGSEYPAIIIPLAMQHFPLLQRNLIYTGITRGKSLVIVIGEQRALKTAIDNHEMTERLTNLCEKLR